VFLLDEIDKMADDYHGDPAAALLEVLDPEQNCGFSDHYLEVPYDLSRVLFITTANSVDGIPYPLLDRMEIIETPGYTENEKLHIAKQFLIPAAVKQNALENAGVSFADDAVLDIIRYRTQESGVRGLRREIEKVCRKTAKKIVEVARRKEQEHQYSSFLLPTSSLLDSATIEHLLGKRKYKDDPVLKEPRVGVCYGLAWSEAGGAVLPVEASYFPGSGELTITGSLGDVMKESAAIAVSYLRGVQADYQYKALKMSEQDVHIHVPEGAVPKDGPSAGITIASALFSKLCGQPPLAGVCMTGELTLTGRVLAIGGLKEKLLAAIRSHFSKVILPADNKEDFDELDADIKNAIEPIFVQKADEVFAALFHAA
jgi:ATP-dependent Lon protease